MSAPRKIEIDGRSLELDDVAAVLRGETVRVALAPAAEERVRRARGVVDEHVAAGDVVYGLTTGFGRLKDVAIAREDLERLQRNLVLSHCCGTGPPMPPDEVRAAMLLRLNVLAAGHSGVRVELVRKIARLLEKGFVPVVPQQGSVGASGDLAPQAHMAAAYLGIGEAWAGGRRTSAEEALRAVGEEPLELGAKEGLALVNGTEVMLATGVEVWRRAALLSRSADAIAALSIEALLGSAKPFDERLSALKGHAGGARAAENVRRCLEGSEVLASHASCNRVQDAYSLRCVPQVHGAFKAALEHAGAVLAGELNAVTDNPVIFPDAGDVVSGGLFHGQPIAVVLDYLALALCTLSNVSERRTEQLVNPDLSHLPPFLTPEPGLNSGLMLAQVTAAALTSEAKSLAHPASVDTIPTSANQEDHVSMGVTAARKARAICDLVERVLAIEWIAAAQAREFRRELRAGRGAEAAQACLRARVAPLREDRYLHADLEAARELLVSGELVRAVEAEVGELLA